MKRTLLSVFVILIFGLKLYPQLNIGIRAGIDAVNIRQNYSRKDFEEETLYRPGLNIGMVADYFIMEYISLQPGLMLTNKGYKTKLDYITAPEEDIEGYNTINYNYLEFPIMCSYHYKGFMASAGSYISVGVGGKNKWDYTLVHEGDEQDFQDMVKLIPEIKKVGPDGLSDKEQAFYLFDYGACFELGYKFKNIGINLQYSLGLANVQADYEENPDYRNEYAFYHMSIGIAACYYFRIQGK